MDRCPRTQVISCFYLAQFNTGNCCILELAAQTFAADPAVAFTATLYIFLAMVFGVAIYHYGISLKVSTIIMLPILFGSLIFGIESSWVQSTFALSLDTWRMALIVYIFAASVLPVWLLLQPRDYLASYMLYFPCLSAVWA